jgi:hypothetical protein
MQSSGAQWIEAGMVVAGALGLLILLAPTFGRKPKQTTEGWLFPVKWTSLLVYWLGFAGGMSAVAYAGRRLLTLGASDWAGWACFVFGFALVLLILAGWPEPLIFDRQGLCERGSQSSRIRWQELSHVRQYQIRHDRGVVLHSVYGKQLVIPGMTYDSDRVLDTLVECYNIPLQSSADEPAPISILSVPLPKQ